MSDSDVVAWYLLAYVFVILASLIAQKAIKKFNLDKIIPEAGATMLLNITVSGVIRLTGGFNQSNLSDSILEDGEDFNAHLLGLSTSLFYYVLLPPIIFNSGYHLKRQIMFANFGAILSLAVIGTGCSIFILATGLYFIIKYGPNTLAPLSIMECITFAALISSTDPVSTLSIYTERNIESNLFYLVFGESILNDAVALSVFSVSSEFVGEEFATKQLIMFATKVLVLLLGSATIGYALGIFNGYLFKLLRLTSSWKDQVLSMGVFMAAIYIPFLVSESIKLSGIVAALAGGIATRRYLNKNVPKSTAIKASFISTLLSHLAETICFAQLGLCVFMQSFNYFNMSFIGITFALIYLARLPVYPILTLVNLYRKVSNHSTRQESNEKFVLISPIYTMLRESNEPSEKRDPENQKYTESIDPMSSDQHAIQKQLTSEIPLKTMHMIYWAGLRGAVSYSCANIFPDQFGNRNVIVTTTIAVVLFTVLVQGGLTDFFLSYLGIAQRNKESENLLLNTPGTSKGDSWIEKLEKKFIYPCAIDPSLQNNNELWSPKEGGSNVSSGGGSVYSTNTDGVVILLSSPKASVRACSSHSPNLCHDT